MSIHPPLRHGEISAQEAAVPEVAGGEVRTPAEAEAAAVPKERPFPSTVGGLCYLVVLVGAMAGLLVVVLGQWRPGLMVMAGSLGLAALFRGVLRNRNAGMLAVRNRWFDMALMLAAGAGIWILAVTVPGS